MFKNDLVISTCSLQFYSYFIIIIIFSTKAYENYLEFVGKVHSGLKSV